MVCTGRISPRRSNLGSWFVFVNGTQAQYGPERPAARDAEWHGRPFHCRLNSDPEAAQRAIAQLKTASVNRWRILPEGHEGVPQEIANRRNAARFDCGLAVMVLHLNRQKNGDFLAAGQISPGSLTDTSESGLGIEYESPTWNPYLLVESGLLECGIVRLICETVWWYRTAIDRYHIGTRVCGTVREVR